ncbi:GDSL esterase/lipase At5g03980-like [Camellia sinensis]|uniref:GDSL esterase/lipase At5g03980-like n=1 Tax=Camellia sinensis TaxID=4442 RepID=UPI001036DDF1|nr:GDSL esterase/lipase At5g03980-like [Camellia sinensis]
MQKPNKKRDYIKERSLVRNQTQEEEEKHRQEQQKKTNRPKANRVGAMRVVVPGNFPMGCLPIFLTTLPSVGPGAYDDLGCLHSLNEFAMFQNNYLQGALGSLRQEFPQVVILYADYYSAFQSVLHRAPFLGFDKQSLLKACCGIGGSYNYDPIRTCGSQESISALMLCSSSKAGIEAPRYFSSTNK